MSASILSPNLQTKEYTLSEFLADALAMALECWNNKDKAAAITSSDSIQEAQDEPKSEDLLNGVPPDYRLVALAASEIAKMEALRKQHPFKLIYGALAKDDSFTCGAVATMQIPNRLIKAGCKVVLLK